MIVFIDVETVPSQAPGALESVRATLRPPGTLRKAESIAAWWATESDQAAADAWRKQSLDGGLAGEIISIAICTDDDREWVHCRQPGEPEDELLIRLFDQVDAWTIQDAERLLDGRAADFPVDNHELVAHNAAFDIGFLWRRATVLGVPRPRWLPGPMARPGRDFADTMTMWAGHGGRVSLDSLCRALRVPSPKDGIDGSQVFAAWLAGRHEEIAAYNLRDVVATRDVWHRLVGLPGAFGRHL